MKASDNDNIIALGIKGPGKKMRIFKESEFIPQQAPKNALIIHENNSRENIIRMIY